MFVEGLTSVLTFSPAQRGFPLKQTVLTTVPAAKTGPILISLLIDEVCGKYVIGIPVGEIKTSKDFDSIDKSLKKMKPSNKDMKKRK